jgi:hypothetical protein
MNRIYHTWDKWECYPAGFYETKGPFDDETCREKYKEFLKDTAWFQSSLQRVLREWPRSCEHYLSNENMNRIAWLGQASMCIATGIPSAFRGGFNRLTEQEQTEANKVAFEALNQWLVSQNESPLTIEQAQSKTEANLY